jgi:endonuclease/exonuclease/phosphatase family metal-dependent hydrolase
LHSKTPELKKFLYYTIVVFFFISALLLILSYVSVYVSPGKIPLLAFLGLFFPFVFGINLLFFLFWMFKRNKLFFVAMILILAGFYRIRDFYSFPNKRNVITADVNTLKVMSFNVRLFDLYKWSKEDDAGNRMLEVIKNENPDIVCLQEFYSDEKVNNQQKIIEFQNTKDYIISDKKQTGYSGVAIFSKYPIISKGYVDVHSAHQKCIYADILKGRDTVRIYSIHLASVHLDNDDYQILKNFDLKEEEDFTDVTGIGSKFLRAYEMRSEEVETIAPHIQKSPYKTIVCGDFNDTPVSWCYRQIKQNMKDAFIEKGNGIGNTYNYGIPFFRIDYILHSSEMITKSYSTSEKFLSDHHAIIAVIEL